MHFYFCVCFFGCCGFLSLRSTGDSQTHAKDSFLMNVNKIHCFSYHDSKRKFIQIQKVVSFL